MMHKNEIIAAMEKIAPPSLAADWDNVGIQIDVGGESITRVLVALEIAAEVIKEAKEKQVDLIITHHPLIFNSLSSVDCGDVTGKFIIDLVEAGISVYSAHTNFDEADGGNNDYLTGLLRLLHTERFAAGAFGRIGDLEKEMNFEEMCNYVKGALNLKYILASGDPSTEVRKVGVCAGAGSDQVKHAATIGCDVFITGDIKHHDARYAAEKGMCVIDAGHYGTEKFFAGNLAGKLLAETRGVIDIYVSIFEAEPFSVCY